MTLKEFAQMLDGREYGHEITKEEEILAKELGFVVVFGYEGKTIDQREGKALTKRQQVGVDFAKRLAASRGMTIYFYESYAKDGKFYYRDENGVEQPADNGFYDPATKAIHIDLNAGEYGGGTVLFTIAHELTHYIKDTAPAQYKKLCSLLMKGYKAKGQSVSKLVTAQQAKAKRRGEKLSFDEAYDEVIADSMESILADGRVMELMGDLEKADRGLADKVKKFFRDIAKLLKDTIDAYRGVKPDSAEGRLVMQMKDIYGQLQEVFAKGVYEGSEAAQGIDNATDSGVRRMARNNYDFSKSFADQLADYQKGVFPADDTFLLGGTPDVLKGIGLIGLPMTINQKHIGDALNGTYKGSQQEKLDHTFTDQELSKLPEKIAEPIAVIYDKRVGKAKASESNVDVLVEMSVASGKQVIVAVQINGNGHINGFRIDTNKVATVHGNTDCIARLIEAINENEKGNVAVFYINNKKTTKVLQSTGNPIPSGLSNLDGFINSISNPQSPVKRRFGSVVETQQFKRWFGDWENHPQNASKVVNADGTPKVMYHGTRIENGEFDVFDESKAIKKGGLGLKALGKGNYFTAKKLDGTERYGSRIIAAYLDIKKPYVYNGGNSFVEQVADVLGLDTKVSYDDLQQAMRDHGYDGVIQYDTKGEIMLAVTFDSNQIKSATNNIGTFDGTNPNIKRSAREHINADAAEQIQKENEQLKEDVSRLKEMLKLQRTVTNGTKFTRTSVDAAARLLKQNAGAKGETRELAGLLNDLYEYIAKGEELTWEGVKEAAQPAAQWLMDHAEHKPQRSEYAEDILHTLRTSRVRLDDTQMAEVEYCYGSYSNFRKSMMGSIVFAKENSMSLDSQWQEWAGMYPDVFDSELSAADMPEALAEIIDRLRNSDTSALEYEYNRDMIEQDLIRQVYDTYWRVSTMKTFADVQQKEINRLKNKHANQMVKLRQDNRAKVEQMKAEHRAKLEELHEDHKAALLTQQTEIRKKHEASRKKAVEGKYKTELRRKIRKTVRELDKILNRGNKKLNVKEDMKDFVSKTLELADYLFTDHISNDELIRKGITVRMTPGEAALVKETEDILSKLYDNADSLTDEEFTKLDAKRKANEEKLRDLLTAQRNERLNTPVAKLFDDLVKAYASLKNSKQDAVKAAYNEELEKSLRAFMSDDAKLKILENMRVADMTTEELNWLYRAYTMVLNNVRNANKFHVKGMNETIDQKVGRIVSDFSSRKIPDGDAAIAARNLANKMGWNYEKLYYALDRIGSEAFTELIMNLANSENIVMEDIIEAALFRDQVVEKYGFNNWAVNKEIDREFLDNTGKEFKLTLGQLMSLYAYSRREGAWDHIEYGGFVFGEAALTNPRPADSYKLSKEQCEAITSTLTKEQKAYVEDMQKFLSETMGEKGNEVSMMLYGIKMFGEKNYFPIHIAGQFKAQAQESQAKAAAGFGSMSNAGFTHAQNPNAKAPFVLEGFNEVWSDHVNEMSRYHGTVPALEDIRRVMNRSSYSDAYNESMSVKAVMENAFSKDAVDYFDNLYREANSGAITDKLQHTSKKLLSLFRKNSVAYSLSVLIQQPASLVRAYAMIDKKYFGFKGFGTITGGVVKAVTSKRNPAYANAYSEMLKYAPGVTMAKEIGGFDTATGGSIRSYLLDTNKSTIQKWKTENSLGKGKAVLDLVDNNAIANLPNVADKIAWIEIWNACKRETVTTHKNLAANSEEFMQAVGERFTEVIRATQVYDSIFAKSPMLKSKNLSVQYLVSFMNEPNTVANMVEKAVRDATKGNWKQGARSAAVVIHSIIFTNLLKSLIYALRDDDEDETYTEKYIEAVVGNMMNDFNPLNYIPVARDVWSIAQGYDVERADMAIVADALDALDRVLKNAFTDTADMTEEELTEFDKKVTEANWKLVESVAAFFGIPIKNIRREINALIDHARIASANAGLTTDLSVSDTIYEAVVDSIPFMSSKKSKGDKLYDAIVSGDKKYLGRLKATYKTDDAYQSAVRKALRENDPRIRAAAQAKHDGKTEEYKRIFRQIQNERKFSFDDIMSAINSEESSIKSGLKADTVSSDYSYTDFVNAILVGESKVAQAMKDDIIAAKIANGMTQEQAEATFTSSISTATRNAFDTGLLDEAGAEKMLVEYAGKDEEKAAGKVTYWAFIKEHPQYREDLSESNVKDYTEFAEPAEIPLDVFVQYLNGTKGLETIRDEWGDEVKSKREQVLEVIDSLPLTWEQKDALYLAAGYAESKIWDVPW